MLKMSVVNSTIPERMHYDAINRPEKYRYSIVDVEDLLLDDEDPSYSDVDYYFMVVDNSTGKFVEYNNYKIFDYRSAVGACDDLNGLIPEEVEYLDDPVELTENEEAPALSMADFENWLNQKAEEFDKLLDEYKNSIAEFEIK